MNKEYLEKEYNIELGFEPREMKMKGCDERAYIMGKRILNNKDIYVDSYGNSIDSIRAEELPDYETPLKIGDRIEAGSSFTETIFIKHGEDDSVIVVDSKDIKSYENGQRFNTVRCSYWRRPNPIQITLKVNGEDKELCELTEKEKEYIKNNL